MKRLLYIGSAGPAEIIAIRPGFDVCCVADTDNTRCEYLARLFGNDPKVRVIHLTPSSVCGPQFYADNGVDDVDTLVISPGDGDKSFCTALGLALLKEKAVRVVGVKVGSGLDEEPDEFATELRTLLALHYEACVQGAEPAGYDAGEHAILARWWRRADSVRTTGISLQKPAYREGKQYSFNCVYFHLRDKNWSVSRRGNVTVTVSSVPQEGCDLYLYHDAFSFRGKQAGYNLLLLAEPLVVLPGQYNGDIWDHFDHTFTFCDMPIERDRGFTKVLTWRGDWSEETAITEDMRERESLFPIEGRQNSICMINGNKCSWVSGELYSKRAEAALWFWDNSDVPFDVYGRPPFLLPNYKGGLEDDVRLPMLGRYRYNWCFENTDHPVFGLMHGEKILDCLETRTVPIYLGNPNIGSYIPKECFIDFRDFGSYEAVNDYLHRITEDDYMTYVEHIDRWVSSGGLRPYSWQTLYDQLTHWYSTQTGIDLRSLTGEETSWERQIIEPRNGVARQPLWTFDELRFRPSQFMDREDLLKTRPWERISAELDGRFQRTMGLASQEEYREALREMALCGFSLNAEHHLVAAQLMQLNGLPDAALVQVAVALQLDPDNSYARNQLGALYFQKNQVPRAEAEFRKAVELDAGNHLARKNLAFLLLHTGRKGEAMPLARIVEPYFPEEVRAWSLS